LSAALLEKLATRAASIRSARRIRTRCTRLIDTDAVTFARVIRASRQSRQAWARALKAAIEVPAGVARHAAALLGVARALRRDISPRYRVDLDCAVLLAKASGQAARALVETNLAWLNDPAYARRVRRRLARLS
jgi:formiminotetrahydrofolate cyclodeaminase